MWQIPLLLDVSGEAETHETYLEDDGVAASVISVVHGIFASADMSVTQELQHDPPELFSSSSVACVHERPLAMAMSGAHFR